MPRRLLFAIFIILILAVFHRLIYPKKMSIEPKTLIIKGITVKIEIADSLPKQIQGLSGRDSLCKDCGMLFVYSIPQILTFWMKDMKFPLDMIFIRDEKISEIYEDVPAPQSDSQIARITTSQSATHVLEVNAGFAKNAKLRVGDDVKF